MYAIVMALVVASFLEFVPLPFFLDEVLELKSIDWRFRIKTGDSAEDSIGEIIIINIDQRSVNKLGKYQRWSSDYHSHLLEYLQECNATTVIFDIVLEQSRTGAEDKSLLAATQKSGRVIHALLFGRSDPKNFLPAMQNPPESFQTDRFVYRPHFIGHGAFLRQERFENENIELLNAAMGNGFVNSQHDWDGIVRKTPLFIEFAGSFYPCLGLAALLKIWGTPQDGITCTWGQEITIQKSDGNTVSIPIDDRGRMWINYQGKYNTFRYISYYDVKEKRVPAALFKDKIIIIGTSLPGLFDLRSVPVQELFPGVEIHSNALYTILSNSFIKKVPKLYNRSILFCLTILIALSALFLRPITSIINGALASGVLVVSSILLFNRQLLIIEVIKPWFGMIIVYILMMIHRYLGEEREKRRIKGYFQQYLAREIVDEVLNNPSSLVLGGEKKEVSILFADIRGFTTISEAIEPDQLVQFLNYYLTIMTEIIIRNKGTLDKYIGDAVVTIFGAPGQRTDHARNAVITAVDMQEKVQDLRKSQNNPLFQNFSIGVGINTDQVIIGNMGSEMIFDYTAIGDGMNLASRLEGLNKYYKTSILISDQTYQQMGAGFICREIDLVVVKGKREAVRIFEILGKESAPSAQEMRQQAELFARALALYREKNWSQAENMFADIGNQFPDDHVSRIFLNRCKQFQQEPPSAGWSGEWVMEKK
ncbi:CHASE2 domain-containing protein [candidate division CSSED10-310 bacterium]|uniref:CHASE2 domain-containing protein n=1 Tax=candidate division CSSED10-310 bacterium TaxID=2855610 RepID=A0ABV6YVP7_UNCC1